MKITESKNILLPILGIFFISSCSPTSGNEAEDWINQDDIEIKTLACTEPVDPGRIKLVGHTPINDTKVPFESIFVTDVWGYSDVTTNREYALVGVTEKENEVITNYMAVIDVTDPESPELVSKLETEVSVFDIKTYSNFAYVGDGGYENFNNMVVDLSDPLNPQIIDNFRSAHNLFIDPDGLLYATENPGIGIYLLDEQTGKPEFLKRAKLSKTVMHDDKDGSASAATHDITVVDDFIYAFNTGENAEIYKIKDNYDIELISDIHDDSISIFHSGWPSENGNYLYITDEYAVKTGFDFSVWDISNIKNPLKIAGCSDPNASAHNAIVSGNYMYTSYYNAGFKVFDVSDPALPILVDSFDTNDFNGEAVVITGGSFTASFSGSWGVYPFAKSGLIYISDDTGLWIFEF